MRPEPIAWVLNLDAEHELEVGRGYAPTARVRAIVARERRKLLGTLVGPDDLVLDGPNDPRASAAHARGRLGLAWSPTASAMGRLRAAGAEAGPAPDPAILARVNARPFALPVRAPLATASFAKCVVTSVEEALEHLGASAAGGWLVRRSYGAAGRGRLRVAAGRPSEHERAWLAASLRRGPVVIEPWVEVTREYTRSGWVGRDGSVVVARPCFQETTVHGAWVRTEGAGTGEVACEDDVRLGEAAEAAGRALAAAGYFGPFGIDAFRHLTAGPHGPREVLNPLSEINARFTMDWLEGFRRSQLDAFARS